MSEDRLSRIENKLDDLQAAVVSLARVEERLVTVFNRQTAIESKVNVLDSKVDSLSESVISSRAVERIVWIVIAAAISAAFRYLG